MTIIGSLQYWTRAAIYVAVVISIYNVYFPKQGHCVKITKQLNSIQQTSFIESVLQMASFRSKREALINLSIMLTNIDSRLMKQLLLQNILRYFIDCIVAHKKAEYRHFKQLVNTVENDMPLPFTIIILLCFL